MLAANVGTQKTEARRGFSLVEAVGATLIVAIVMTASLRGLGEAVRHRAMLRERERAWRFATDLIAEAVSLPYQDPDVTGSGSIGLDGGESASDRTTFDDVDDFHGYAESPLKTRSGAVIPNTAGWSRAAYVFWTDPNQPDEFAGSDEGMKVVSVLVTTPSGLTVGAAALRARVDKQSP
jgi:type II secretory pathway pseudopilin PulG